MAIMYKQLKDYLKLENRQVGGKRFGIPLKVYFTPNTYV